MRRRGAPAARVGVGMAARVLLRCGGVAGGGGASGAATWSHEYFAVGRGRSLSSPSLPRVDRAGGAT